MVLGESLVFWWRNHRVCLLHDPEPHDYPFESGRFELLTQ